MKLTLRSLQKDLQLLSSIKKRKYSRFGMDNQLNEIREQARLRYQQNLQENNTNNKNIKHLFGKNKNI